jgi:hypothetical protein
VELENAVLRGEEVSILALQRPQSRRRRELGILISYQN